jgi:hypothetical protein
LTTQLVDNLIRLVAADGRFARGGQGIPRVFAAIAEMPLATQKFCLSGGCDGLVPVTLTEETPNGLDGPHRRRVRRAKRKGPGDAGAPPETVSCLGLTATAIGAAAAQESPKPTHDLSPVHTAHEEQLTERIP